MRAKKAKKRVKTAKKAKRVKTTRMAVDAGYMRKRSTPVKNLDPELALSYDIVKFILDWAAISKIDRIDEIMVDLEGAEVKPKELEDLVDSLLFRTKFDNTRVIVREVAGKYKCHDSTHVTHKSERCHICSSRVTPIHRVKLSINTAKKGKAQIILSHY